VGSLNIPPHLTVFLHYLVKYHAVGNFIHALCVVKMSHRVIHCDRLAFSGCIFASDGQSVN